MKRVISVAVASALFSSSGSYASVSDAEWQQFKAQFEAMKGRVDALEVENQHLRKATKNTIRVEDLEATNTEVASLKEKSTAVSWAEKVKWNGDFRYRFEDIEEDGKDDRDRNRIRARAALIAQPSDTTEVGLGLASGGDDPVSTNQTLGGGGSSKELRLDLAYLKWTGMEDTFVTAGKFVNPYYSVQKTQLIWDGDFRPEGVGIGWANDRFFANATYSFIESDSRDDDDGIWGVQVGARFSLTETMTLTTAAKYLDIPTKGREAIYDNDFFGNSSVLENGVEVYEYDYNLMNASADLGFILYDMPLSIFADYVQNDDADDFDTGYLAGIKLGKAKKKGTWQVAYQYENLEANATLGLVTDSDFAGGGTDGKGHRFSTKYAIDNSWYVAATYFDSTRGVDLGNDADYKRLQIDTGFKY